MDLKVSLKSENGLLNFLKENKRKKKHFFGYHHLSTYDGTIWRHMVPYDGAKIKLKHFN
jgi:hypothetical protein